MKNYLLFSFFIAIGFQTILAQDSLELPKYSIPHFITIKNEINKPASIFPIIGEKELHQKKDFEIIKSTAERIPDSLKLEYIEYSSESDPTWESEENFKNHFVVNADFEPYGNSDYSELNFVLDETNTATILSDKRAEFERGVSISSESGNVISLSKRIVPNTSSQVNLSGKLFVSVKYLTGYDTIIIDKSRIGQNSISNHHNLHLQKIANGDLYFKNDNGLELKDLEEFKYIAYNDDGDIIHEPNQDVAPSRFSGTTAISSLFLNEETLMMTDDEYRAYLNNLKFSKSNLTADFVVLMTDLDFDKIILLYPKFGFTPPKELEVQVKRKNKDDIQLIKHEFSIEPETKKEKRLDSN